jgi:hypothetical protein
MEKYQSILAPDEAANQAAKKESPGEPGQGIGIWRFSCR